MTRQVLLSQILPVVFGENFTGSVKVSFAKDSLTLASDDARCTVPGNTLGIERQLVAQPTDSKASASMSQITLGAFQLHMLGSASGEHIVNLTPEVIPAQAETPSTLESVNYAITLVDGKVTAVTKEEVKSKPANSRTRSAGASSTSSRFTRFD